MSEPGRASTDSGNGSWHEWGRHVLSELDRIDRRISDLDDTIVELRTYATKHSVRIDAIEVGREKARSNVIVLVTTISTAVGGLASVIANALLGK